MSQNGKLLILTTKVMIQ